MNEKIKVKLTTKLRNLKGYDKLLKKRGASPYRIH